MSSKSISAVNPSIAGKAAVRILGFKLVKPLKLDGKRFVCTLCPDKPTPRRLGLSTTKAASKVTYSPEVLVPVKRMVQLMSGAAAPWWVAA